MKHVKGFLATPPLWVKEQFGIRQFEFPSIDLNGFVPKEIPHNLRLGHQVEHIFRQLIDYDSTYELVSYNIQLKKKNITIGELDFLLKNNCTGQYHHIELTYKFYILDPAISEPIHRAMGPNRKDMFFTKMEKTRDQHFKLLYSPEGLSALRDLGISEENIQQECCFLTQLFTPRNQKIPSIRPLNPNCITGSWLNFKEFNSANLKSYEFYIPHKYEWLHTPHPEVEWMNHYQCLLEINMRHLNERAPMIWLKKEDGTIEKLFVVWW